MTALDDAAEATASAWPGGTATDPSDWTPKRSSDAGAATMPSTDALSAITRRTLAPTSSPSGIGTATDHHPGGIGDWDATTEDVSGSPCRIDVKATLFERSTSANSPAGIRRHSTTDAEIDAPAAISEPATG